jgi:two-component system, NtrC family, nitrogen regulation sensor histidine kinase NtrY
MMVTAGGEVPGSWRPWLFPLLGGAALALALWARSPAVPNIAPGDTARTIEFVRASALTDLERNLRQTLARLESAAAVAMQAPPEPAAAFASLANLQGDSPDWGVILYDSARPLAWSGRLRVNVDTLVAPLSIVTTPLYTVLAVTRSSGDRRAVATAVIHAAPPANRISIGVAERVARRHPIAGFVLNPVQQRPAVVLPGADGAALVTADVLPLSPAEMRLASAGRLRARVAIACGLLLLVFLAVAARQGTQAERVAALVVTLVVLGLIPFNAFSGASRIFDPSYYYAAAGGPWTANGGAFLLTSIVVVLGVIAFVRGRPLVRRRLSAALVSMALLTAGFFVVRALAEGIGQPARGATVLLWLSWQIPLFLVALGFLLPAAWVVDTGFRRRRRLTRRSFVAVSLVASVVAASLVWLTTVGQRIRLAEADVIALHHGQDEYLDVLLARLARTLGQGPAPQSRVDLLRAYAESELAIAGYSFALARWDAGGRFLETLDLTVGVDDSAIGQPVVHHVLATGRSQTAVVPGPLGAVWVAAVPHPSGGITSIVSLPRSRIAVPDPHAALLGVPVPSLDDPPYTVTVAEGMAPPPDGGLRWWRAGRELHADAPLLTSAGLTRAHIEIDLRSPEALGQRLVLVMLLNLTLAGLLALLVRASEPGFGRRTRVRFRHWAGSFRSRLTLALFAFFFLPAVAFTAWGYSRLAAENRQLRRLVVRETLHAATAARDMESLASMAERLRTPLFVYDDGLLAASSDTLIDVLAPLGRALPPAVQLHLALSGELTANWEQSVGDARVMVGYRAIAAPPAPAVLAAPARGSDEMTMRRARDLGILLLFATAVGALAALWLSGVAAHQFGRPIAALRRAARAVARGDRRPPELPRAPSEFEPVFAAFRRMGTDLERSRVELARAERVLAWGEMARQVAHEIKNPLTPIRLGVQYLQRARKDARIDFDTVFEENTARILQEIDRLDEIARAFSRYGSAPTDLPPPESVDVAFVLRDLVAFERMGASDTAWRLTGADHECLAVARREELREVLMNVFENARAARARTVTIALQCAASGVRDDAVTVTVRDDGMGIAPEVLPRIFEPHFSTRTTGSGLGLAISRRLLDAWGGSITIDSEPGDGAVVVIRLLQADATPAT